MRQLVTDDMAQAAFDWLAENTDTAAHARAMRVKAEYATKRAKARAFLEESGTIAEREAKALCSDMVSAPHSTGEGRMSETLEWRGDRDEQYAYRDGSFVGRASAMTNGTFVARLGGGETSGGSIVARRPSMKLAQRALESALREAGDG